MAIGRGFVFYCLPEVSMTAQRRTIHSFTTVLLLLVLVILMMVGTRRVTMQTPEGVSILHRVFAAVSPVLDGHYAPVMIPGDRGESPVSPGISHKLTHWTRSLNHQGPWLLMLPRGYALDKSKVRHSSQFGGRIAVPSAEHRRRSLDATWREQRLEEIRASLSKSSVWGSYQLIDYHESLSYLDLITCDNVVVYSVHPVNATELDAELLRHAFEWDTSIPLDTESPQCILNMFPYESQHASSERYEAVLRTMHMQLSGTLAVSAPKKTVPWIVSPSRDVTFTGMNVPVQSIIQKFAQTTTNDLPKSAGIRALQQADGNADVNNADGNNAASGGKGSLFNRLIKWLWNGDGGADDEALRTVPASESVDPDQLPYEEEPGLQTIEQLMCLNNTNNLSCNGEELAPQMHRLAYLIGTRPTCHYKFGPHVSSAMQIFRPSPLAALIAGTMRELLAAGERELNESILLSKILMSLSGLHAGDFSGICRAKLDGYVGRRRWYDACRKNRRLVSVRAVDPKRFSGNENSTIIFDLDSDADVGHVFVHEAELDFTKIYSIALKTLREQADLWLLPAAESAFRFFNGHVSSGDWILEGPDSIAYACGRWLFGSGCENDITSAGIIAESAAWTCGDLAVGFPTCSTSDYYKSPFRAQVLNRFCNIDLPWLTDNDGEPFTLAKFARGIIAEKDEDVLKKIVPNEHLQKDLRNEDSDEEDAEESTISSAQTAD